MTATAERSSHGQERIPVNQTVLGYLRGLVREIPSRIATIECSPYRFVVCTAHYEEGEPLDNSDMSVLICTQDADPAKVATSPTVPKECETAFFLRSDAGEYGAAIHVENRGPVSVDTFIGTVPGRLHALDAPSYLVPTIMVFDRQQAEQIGKKLVEILTAAQEAARQQTPP